EAKLEVANNLLNYAKQSLEQSNSIFEIRKNNYDRAINRLILANILNKEGKSSLAISEVKLALSTFNQLGASLDSQKAITYIELLEKIKDSTCSSLNNSKAVNDSTPPSPSPHSTDYIFDNSIMYRLIHASVSHELLLHELAAIATTKTESKASIILEITEASD